MSDYLYGCDVLGANDGNFADAVKAAACAERPMSAERARDLICFAFVAMTDMNRVDLEEETVTWRDDMARQLAHMDEMIANAGRATVPDKAADVLCDALASIAEMMEEGAEFYPQLERGKDRFLQSIGVGIQVLGAGEWEMNDDVVGTNPNISDWDKTSAYSKGAVVRYWGAYYKAVRDIDSASFLWGNDSPDSSDAWVEVPASQVIYSNNDSVLGDLCTILGMFDIGGAQQKMNALKPVTVGAAKALISGGLKVMGVANEEAAASNLPLQTNRDEVVGHLHWHQNKLDGLKDDKAIYDSGDDAKKWAMQAFIEANAVEEGAAYLDEAWSQMWTEIGQNLASVPSKIVSYAGGVVSTAVEKVTGLPMWAWSLVIIGGAGLLTYGAYKILSSSGGQAVLGAYLGARR